MTSRPTLRRQASTKCLKPSSTLSLDITTVLADFDTAIRRTKRPSLRGPAAFREARPTSKQNMDKKEKHHDDSTPSLSPVKPLQRRAMSCSPRTSHPPTTQPDDDEGMIRNPTRRSSVNVNLSRDLSPNEIPSPLPRQRQRQTRHESKKYPTTEKGTTVAASKIPRPPSNNMGTQPHYIRNSMGSLACDGLTIGTSITTTGYLWNSPTKQGGSNLPDTLPPLSPTTITGNTSSSNSSSPMLLPSSKDSPLNQDRPTRASLARSLLRNSNNWSDQQEPPFPILPFNVHHRSKSIATPQQQQRSIPSSSQVVVGIGGIGSNKSPLNRRASLATPPQHYGNNNVVPQSDTTTTGIFETKIPTFNRRATSLVASPQQRNNMHLSAGTMVLEEWKNSPVATASPTNRRVGMTPPSQRTNMHMSAGTMGLEEWNTTPVATTSPTNRRVGMTTPPQRKDIALVSGTSGAFETKIPTLNRRANTNTYTNSPTTQPESPNQASLSPHSRQNNPRIMTSSRLPLKATTAARPTSPIRQQLLAKTQAPPRLIIF